MLTLSLEQDMRNFLQDFALYKPSSEFIQEEGRYTLYEDAQSAIAFSPPSARRHLPSASSQSSEDANGHKLNVFDPSIFSLPLNAANKIRSFIELFRLEVDSNSAITSGKAVPSSSSRPEVVEPRWHLWTMSECEW
jgi:hypothetical protein